MCIRDRVKVFDRTGKLVKDLALPGLGTSMGFGGRRNYKETFYAFTSYNTPPIIYRLDLATFESKVWKQPQLKFNPQDLSLIHIFTGEQIQGTGLVGNQIANDLPQRRIRTLPARLLVQRREPVHCLRTNAPWWIVDHPAQRQLIMWIGDQLQIGHGVFDLFAIKERLATNDVILDARRCLLYTSRCV